MSSGVGRPTKYARPINFLPDAPRTPTFKSTLQPRVCKIGIDAPSIRPMNAHALKEAAYSVSKDGPSSKNKVLRVNESCGSCSASSPDAAMGRSQKEKPARRWCNEMAGCATRNDITSNNAHKHFV